MAHGIFFCMLLRLEQQHAEVKSNQAIHALLKKPLFEILTLTLENEAKLWKLPVLFDSCYFHLKMFQQVSKCLLLVSESSKMFDVT